MKKSKAICFTVIFFILFVTGHADALIITTDDNYYGSIYIGNSRISGIFDISRQLSGYDQPYEINSAYVTLTLTDNNDLHSTNIYNSAYKYTESYIEDDKFYMEYIKSQIYYYYDGSEWAELSIADQSLKKYTDFYGYEFFLGKRLDNYEYSSLYVTKIYYTEFYKYEYGYKGEITLELSLGESAIADLREDGKISYFLDVSGGMFFESGILTTEIKTSPVPEPSTLLLSFSGLLTLSGFRKKTNR